MPVIVIVVKTGIPMNVPVYDIAISGAGPAGSALALALARKSPHPERIALMGTQFGLAPTQSSLPKSAPDPRTLALNHGSRVLLQQLGAWPDAAADILTVHVSQRGRLGRTLIDHAELGVPRLGSVTSYDALLGSLHEAVTASGVTCVAASPSPGVLNADRITFQLNEQALHSKIAVQSDGARPQGIQRGYGQHAVLATVRAVNPATGWAYERFTHQGPLAILPHPQGDGVYAVVWCCRPEFADELLALSDEEFALALYDTFGSRLGGFVSLGSRHVFPLSLHAGPSLINRRCVAVGNAAQTLHPVAGQGLNLGLRDVAQLAHALTPWLVRTHTDPEPYLKGFATHRRPDRWLTAAITDFLPRAFATGNPLVDHAAGLALLGLDLLPPLRKSLAGHLLQGLRT